MKRARTAVTLAMVAAASLVGQAATAGVGAWRIQSSPNVTAPANAQLTSVACATASKCFAVGELDGTVGSVPLIEQWNGTVWSLVDAPSPPGAVSGRLRAVTCADASSCVAVGEGGGGPLIERWDGSRWSLTAFPSVDGATFLTGVSCPAKTTCFAVGLRFAPRSQPVIARSDGNNWTIVATPDLPGESGLNAVACPSVTDCFAVGETFTVGEPADALVAHWDGSDWSRALDPVANESQQFFNGVACPNATQCFAVGSLTIAWDGASWSDSAGGSVNGNSAAVACAAVSQCLAVAADGSAARWDGSTWATIATPPPNGTDQAGLFGVTCVSASECFAVGNIGQPFEMKTLVERWSGTEWSRSASPTPTPAAGVLSAVTCRTADRCIAVGRNTRVSWTRGQDEAALIERWNGIRWSIDTVPGSAADSRRLAGVVCASAARCFAVGTQYALNAFSPRSLMEQWDGRRWTIVDPVTSVGSGRNELSGAACAGEKRCFAVGYYTPATQPAPLVDIWDGTKWALSASPNVNRGSLYAVSCPSSTTCFAVGLKNGSGTPAALIERWTGGKWSVMASPAPVGARFSQLASVACATTKSCFAVGRYTDSSSRKPFVERWNGERWLPVAAPSPTGATKPELSAVACTSATECTAVGRYDIGKATNSLVERWHGSRWAIEANVAPAGARSTLLSGVACTGTTTCVAVGNAIIKNVQKTFVERRL